MFVLRREDFLSFLEREPKVAIKIIALLCQRIRWQSERMEESVLQPLPVRLARRLCALATDFGSEVHISQEQLGVFVGAARESVNRQLQLWRKDGILDLQRLLADSEGRRVFGPLLAAVHVGDQLTHGSSMTTSEKGDARAFAF